MLTVEVNLAAIRSNVMRIKAAVKTEICAVVKANAYGLGVQKVIGAIDDYVSSYAVATMDEAEELVTLGISKPIIVLFDGGVPIADNVCRVISGVNELKTLTRGQSVVIAVNTGMNREGCAPTSFKKIIEQMRSAEIDVYCAYTHLFDHSDEKLTEKQLKAFMKAVKPYRKSVRLSVAASNALTLKKRYRLDIVRAGLAMYGYEYAFLTPAVRIYTDVIQVRAVKRGEHVGYGSFTVESDMKLALLRVGYGDGFTRTEGHHVSINGARCKIVGHVCMDVCMADVTHVPCHVGDVAYLLGEMQSMETVASEMNTVAHNVLTMLNSRARRVYIEQ